MTIYVLKKTLKQGRNNKSLPSSEWRQMMIRVRKTINKGSCKRLIVNKNGRPDRVGIESSYLHDTAFEKADTLLYTVDESNLTSFALLKFDVDSMEIIAVCSIEGTSAKPVILKALEMARTTGTRKHAYLHALPHVLTYYPRYGFKRHASGAGNNVDGYLMEKNLSNTVNWHDAPPKSPETPSMVVLRPTRKRKATPETTPPPPPSTPKMFHRTDIVWVKYGEHPWWPAQIVHPTTRHMQHPPPSPDYIPVVFFDGTGEIAWIEPSKIATYDPTSKKYRTSTKSKALQQALKDANAAFYGIV